MIRVEVIDGEIFTDERGSISSVNGFDAEDIRRFYLIQHPDTSVIRGWNAHKFERKWFYCIKGAFTLALVKIDRWDNPSAAHRHRAPKEPSAAGSPVPTHRVLRR